MNQNELHQGETIAIPPSFIRSVSLQKLRAGSPLSSKNTSHLLLIPDIPNNQAKRPLPQSNLYSKIIDSKLQVNAEKKNFFQNKPVCEKYEKKIDQNKFKIEELRREKQVKEMKECTFKPHINLISENIENRSIQGFFQDQLQFHKKKEDKIEQVIDLLSQMREIMQSNQQKQHPFHPQLSNKNNNDIQTANQVYQRLYEQYKQKDKLQKDVISRQNSQETIRTNRTNTSITKNKRFQGLSRKQSVELSNQSNTNVHENLHKNGNNLNILNKKMNYEPKSMELSKDMRLSQFEAYSIQLQNNEKSTQFNKQNSIDSSSIQLTDRSNRVLKQKTSKDVTGERKCQMTERREGQMTERRGQIIERREGRNEELLLRKLLKEIRFVMDGVGLGLQVSYLQMNLFFEKMYELSYLRNFINADTSMVERKHLYEIWNMLQGDCHSTVPIVSLIKIVFAIMGCHSVQIANRLLMESWLFQPTQPQYKLSPNNQTNHQTNNQTNNQTNQQTISNTNVLILSQKDSKSIRNTFETFYLNRLKSGESGLIKQSQAQQLEHKPQISKASTELAQKYRYRVILQSQKLLNQNKMEFTIPNDGYLDHVSLLLLDEKRKQANLQHKREEKLIQQKRNQDSAMISFHQSQRESSQSSKTTLKNKDRNLELYEMGKYLNHFKKDKTSDQLDQEKWKNQLTFKPALQPFSSNAFASKEVHVPDFEKSILRMHEGRKHRLNSLQNKQKMQQNNESPILYLNVVMEGSDSVKVPVFQSDNIKSVTEKVRLMIHLEKDQTNHQKLEQILKMQILPALKQMGMEQFMNY